VIARKRRMHGMSLIELMIVVVIVGILAAIAYPSYREFAARATRTEAKSALLKAAVNQERYYLQNNKFSADLNELGFSSNPYTTDTGTYIINVAAPNPASNFTVTATYQFADAEGGKCGVFTIDGRGVKESSPLADCWARTR
jgi:type IV pilus assembly protein PilE